VELSKDEVNKRLIRLRNLERLYVIARERITFLEKENKELKLRIKDCELQNSFSSHFSTQHKTPQFSVIYQKSVSFQTIIVS
jgi:hypothetical protein